MPILSTLNQYERLTIADALTSESFKEDEVVIEEGEEGNKFYIVESGEFKVNKRGVAEEVHTRLTAGDYFGERALLTNEVRAALTVACVCVVALPAAAPRLTRRALCHLQARAATITATAASVCQVLDRATFMRLLGPLGDIMRSNMEVYNKYKDSVPADAEEETEGKKEASDSEDED